MYAEYRYPLHCDSMCTVPKEINIFLHEYRHFPYIRMNFKGSNLPGGTSYTFPVGYADNPHFNTFFLF